MKRLHLSALLISCFATIGWAVPARAQVWVDANELKGKLPDWVDPKYYHADPPPAIVVHPPRAVWVEPVYRTVCRRVWREPVKEIVYEHVWIEARQETREVVYFDSCGCRHVRYEQVFVPGHYEDRAREIVRSPGCWEMVEVRELVTPGHWVEVALRD